MTRKRKEKAAQRKALRPQPPQVEPDFSSDQAYWLALGEFVEAFARAEGMLFMYLIHAIGVEKLVGKALFAREKCDVLIKRLRSTWEVRAQSVVPDYEELDSALTQLKHISEIRNKVIHQRSHVFPDRGRVTTNLLRAHSPLVVQERPVSPHMLQAMTADIERISQHFVSLRMYPAMTTEQRSRVFQFPLGAWRYTHVPNPHRKGSSPS